MLKILTRTLLIYITLTFVMRLMGKRQLGELQISELISTLVLSEVAHRNRQSMDHTDVRPSRVRNQRHTTVH